jgi:hypothetical protein
MWCPCLQAPLQLYTSTGDWHAPAHTTPLPVKFALQVQVKDPWVSWHVALAWQLFSVLSAHSFTSEYKKGMPRQGAAGSKGQVSWE